LRKEIDTGPIIARKKYPPPPPEVDPDYVYDSAIRSDLLIDVLQEHSRHNKFDNLLNQPLVGNNYYVIHPVLKHIALLKNESMHS
jgi:methionyl-tRNA formyltransferase